MEHICPQILSPTHCHSDQLQSSRRSQFQRLSHALRPAGIVFSFLQTSERCRELSTPWKSSIKGDVRNSGRQLNLHVVSKPWSIGPSLLVMKEQQCLDRNGLHWLWLEGSFWLRFNSEESDTTRYELENRYIWESNQREKVRWRSPGEGERKMKVQLIS